MLISFSFCWWELDISHLSWSPQTDDTKEQVLSQHFEYLRTVVRSWELSDPMARGLQFEDLKGQIQRQATVDVGIMGSGNRVSMKELWQGIFDETVRKVLWRSCNKGSTKEL